MRDRIRGAAAVLAPFLSLAMVIAIDSGKRWHG